MEKASVIKRLSVVYLLVLLAAPISYLIRIFYARSLTPEEYGLFYSLVAFIGLITIFNSLGTGPAMTHYLPKFLSEENRRKIKSLVTMVFSLEFFTSIVCGVLIFAFREELAAYFFKNEASLLLLPLFVGVFFSHNIFNWFTHFFKGCNQEKLYSSMNPSRLAFVLVFSWASALFFGQDLLKSFAVVWILSYLAGIMLYSIPFFRIISSSLKEKAALLDKELLKIVLKYGSLVMVSAAAGMLLERINVLMLTYMQGLESVAFYEIAFPIASAPLVFITPLTSFLFPSISKLYHERNFELIKSMIRAIYNLGLFLYLPISLLLLIFPQEVVLIFFGEKYLVAKTALQILSVGCIFFGLSRINFVILDGIGQIKKRSYILYWGALVNVALNIPLIRFMGIEGAAISTSIGFFIMFLLSLLYLKENLNQETNLNFSWPYKNWIKIFLNSALFCALAWSLKSMLALNMYLETVIILTFCGTIYVFIGFMWKIIDYKMLKGLWVEQFQKAGTDGEKDKSSD